MGTFLGHFVPGVALTVLGLWHTINTIKCYCFKGANNFSSRFWYSVNSSLLKLKELELILLFSLSLLTVILQILNFPSFHLSFELINFEHATMFLHLAIFSGFSLFAELTQISESVFSLIGLMATSVFAQELFLLHFHSTDHVGLEGHYHSLLQLIVLFSLLASMATTIFPSCFPAALVLSLSVVFQGCWFVNMGFVLWVPKLVAEGCFMEMDNPIGTRMVHGTVSCMSSEADFRARALANLQFSWILAGIMILTGAVSLIFTKTSGPTVRQLTAYQQVQSRTADTPAAIDSKQIVGP